MGIGYVPFFFWCFAAAQVAFQHEDLQQLDCNAYCQLHLEVLSATLRLLLLPVRCGYARGKHTTLVYECTLIYSGLPRDSRCCP